MKNSEDLKRFVLLSLAIAIPIDTGMLIVAAAASEHSLRNYVDFFNLAPLIVVAVLFLRIMPKITDKSLKTTTLIIAIGFLFQLAFGFIWFYYFHISSLGRMPYVSIGDFFYLGSYALWTGATVPYLRRYGGLMGLRSRTFLVIYAVVAGVIVYLTVGYWYDAAIAYGYDWLSTVVWLSYAVVPTICLFLLLATSLLYGYEGYGKGLLANYWLYFMVPIIMIAAADILNGFYYVLSEKSVPGRLDDVLYLASYAIAAVAAYTVLKSKLERASMEPSIEQHILRGKTVSIVQGRGHIVEDPKSNLSFEILSGLIAADEQGHRKDAMIISRRNPAQIQGEFNIKDIPVTWITTTPGEGVIDPTRPNLMAHAIMEFLSKTQGGVVLLDGVESVIVYNDFGKTLKMLEQINDFVMQYRGYLLIPIDPKAFDAREKAIMERNFEVISATGSVVRA